MKRLRSFPLGLLNPRARDRRLARRTAIEPLESRYAPATFAGVGGPGLEVRLDPGEVVTIVSTVTGYTVTSAFNAVDGGNTGGHVLGFNSPTATIDANAFSIIHVIGNAGADAVTFGTSTSNYTSEFDIQLTDPTAGGITFAGTSNFAGGLTAKVFGNITQTAPVTSQSANGISLTTINGSITLTDAANNFSVVSLETSPANSAALRTLATLTLDHVTTGTLSITAGSGIGQTSTGRIAVEGTATFDITGGTGVSLALASAANFFGGPVVITESGGDLGEVRLRNVSPTATLPDLSDLATTDLTTLQLVFDGTGLTIDAATETRVTNNGTLILTAGGSITQTAPITVGTLVVTALGNNGITLTDPANNVGTVSLNNPDADGGAASAVSYVNSGALNLGNSQLGLGTATVTAGGSITQVDVLVQRLGAGLVTLNATAGTTVDVGAQGNVFAKPVKILGPSVTTVNVRDGNTLAGLPDLADVSDTLTDLTLNFDNAPVVLPSMVLTNLTVTADGIYQVPGQALLIATKADFNAGKFEIDLPSTGNDFNTLRLRSSGREDVHIVDVDDIAFGGGNSDVGTGKLLITAGGAITQTANRLRQAAGAGAVFISAPSVTLGQGTNDFTGEVHLNVTGPATLVDTSSIVLGTGSITGNLSVTASANITQQGGATLTVGGTSVFNSGTGNAIALANPGNAFTGTVQFADGNVTLRTTGNVSFAGANPVDSLRVFTTGQISQAAGSTLVVTGDTNLEAGSAGIDLNLTGNNFQGPVGAITTGPVTLRDTNEIQLGEMQLGSGTLTVNAAGAITQLALTKITQSGPGALSFLGGAGANVTLSQPGNDFRGTITVDGASVNFASLGDITFSSGSDIDDNLTLVAGGVVTLPTVAGNLGDLNTVAISAAKTIVGTSLTVTGGAGGINFVGAVEFAAGITIDTSAINQPVVLDGDVTALGALTFKTGTSDVRLPGGTWDQGANDLTITSTGQTALELGDFSTARGVLRMTGGSLNLNVAAGGSALVVRSDGVFHVGGTDGTAETVTIHTGAVDTDLAFGPGSTFEVGFGATNDKVVLSGLGSVVLSPFTRLFGSGAAGASATPVVEVTGGGTLVGSFSHSLSPMTGLPQPFLAGSDIVNATYLPSSVAIGIGGPTPAGTFTGYLPDGDRYTVTHSGGAAAGLVVIQNDDGQIDVAVRNNTGAGKLTITTTKFAGDGFTDVGGIGVNGPGSVTISASTSNVRADILVQGALTSLTVRDVLNDQTSTVPQFIRGSGAASTLTSITGRRFEGVQIELGGVLNSFSGASFTSLFSAEPAAMTAERFGTIAIKGDAAANIVGDLNARLTNHNTANAASAVSKVTAANLQGTWDLDGSVGTVTISTSTRFWNLGPKGAGTVNVHGITSTGALSLGQLLDSNVLVSGAIPTLKAGEIDTVGITAGSIGTFTVGVNPAKAGASGQIDELTVELTGNAGGMALKTFSTTGSILNSSFHFADGNVGTFTVARELSDSLLHAESTANGGRFTTLSVGRWDNTDLDGKSIGTFKVIGNAAAGIFGDVIDSAFSLDGNSSGLGLSTFSALFVTDTSFNLLSGGIGTFTVTRELIDSSLFLMDTALGGIKTVTVGDWDNTDLQARTIGTLKTTGAAQVSPESPLLVGNLNNSAILAYLDTGTAPGIGTFSVAGNVSSDFIAAHNGITTFTAKRAVSNTTIIVDSSQATVGRIGTFTAGTLVSSNLVANSIGKLALNGFTIQEGTTPTFVDGAITSSLVLAIGASASGAHSGVDSLNVLGSVGNSSITARSGAGTLSIRGVLSTTPLTFDDPLNVATSGKVTKITVGQWEETTLRANLLGTLQTVVSAADDALGTFHNPSTAFPEITVAGSAGAATDPVALTTLTVAGDLISTDFNVPGGVKTFKVAGTVLTSEIAAGFAANARIATLTAGQWNVSDLTTRVISTMNVTGQASRGLAGNVIDSLITIMGNSGNVALGTFSAQGAVEASTFQVTDGNVTSFTVGKFLESQLYVGYRPGSMVDLTQGGTFGATDRTIGTFKTTQAFDPADPDSVSFQGSYVVAADLGAVTLNGVATAADRPFLFGIGFETGGTAGTVKANTGTGLVTVTAPFTVDAFTYRGL